MLSFAHPFWFFLLPLVGMAAWFLYRRRVRTGLIFAPVARLPHQGQSWRTQTAACLPALFLLSLALMIVALARPRNVFARVRRTANALAIEMVVDVSESMSALDMSDFSNGRLLIERTRLDKVKKAFAEFVKKRPDDLIGLITFGGYASTRAPLTADTRALLHVLEGAQIPRGNVDRTETLTAIGDALATACARLEHAKARSRVIVFLSDGVPTAGIIAPEDGIKMAKDLGIKIYSIGVGSRGQTPIRGRDLFGRNVLTSAMMDFDEALLKRMAEETDGRYFNVRDPEGMDAAMESINELETTRVEQHIYRRYQELFPWFLTPAIGLLLLGVSLNMAITRRLV